MTDIVAKVENRTTLRISRRLIFGLLCCCVAFQRHYGGPWSILHETIWSLTSPRARRISGSKNFRSPPRKDFCNNICQKQTLPNPMGLTRLREDRQSARKFETGRDQPSCAVPT